MFAVLGAIAAFLAFAVTSSVLGRITDQQMPASLAALELSREAEKIAAIAPRPVIAPTRADQLRIDHELRNGLAKINLLLKRLEKAGSDPARFAAIDNAVTELRRSLAEIQLNLDPWDDLDPSDKMARVEKLMTSNSEVSERLASAVDSVVAGARADIVRAGEDVIQSQRTSGIALLAIVGLSIAGSALIVWLYVGRSIVRRLTALGTGMLQIAEGNLEAKLPDDTSGDEIGRMAGTLRIFRDSAAENERSVASSAFSHRRLQGLLSLAVRKASSTAIAAMSLCRSATCGVSLLSLRQQSPKS
jgi:HAMP domain-containing protein